MKLKQKWNRSNDCSQKMLLLLGYKFKNCYLVKRGGGGRTDFWWGDLFFKVGEGSKFLAGGGELPPIPSVRETMMDGFNFFTAM